MLCGLGVHGDGDFWRKIKLNHLSDFLRAFCIPAQLRHAAPFMIEHHRQRVVQAAGESKRRWEEAGKGGIVLAEQRIERTLAVSGGAFGRRAVGAV